MTKDELIKVAVSIALKFEIDPALVCAVCHHESANWQPYAVRYEPAFYARYIQPMASITSDTEKTLRATSFGLMQIMGQVARELGFDGAFLAELFDPVNACTYGCKKLKRELDKHAPDVNAGLLAYNGGGNPDYPALVLAHYKEYDYLNSATRMP